MPRSSPSSTRLHGRAATGCSTWRRISPIRRSPSCRRRRTTATATSRCSRSICYAEYKGFFHIGMVTRNDRNAIIQHGTMTMIRRDAARRAAAGPSGASPRTPSSACACSTRAIPPPTCSSRYGRGADAGPLHRLQEAALPLGLRRHADPEAPRRHAVPRARHRAHARAALPLPGRLAALVRRRAQPVLHRRRPGVDRPRCCWCPSRRCRRR